MTINFPLIFTLPSEPVLKFMAKTLTTKSQLTRYTQTLAMPDGLWHLKAHIWVQTPEQNLAWRAFINPLQGSAGIFNYYILDKFRAEKDGLNFADGTDFDDLTGFSNSYTPDSDAAQGTTNLVFSGFPAQDNIRKGNYIQIGGHLHMVTSVSLNAGVYTLGIWPPLREAITTATNLVFDYPVIKMRMQDDEQGMPDPDSCSRYDLTFEVIEAFECLKILHKFYICYKIEKYLK